MAMHATTASPETICKAFVEQYYHILHKEPDQLHKFYNDTSTVGWVASDGVMECVATLPEINKKIMSMDFSKYLININTADAVLSLNGSALIVVTGSLTLTSDDVCQRFTQTFFLAPQESGGYFVLNDILRLLSKESKESGKNQEVADTAPAAVEERLTTDPVVMENNAAGSKLPNPTVNGTAVGNTPTVNGLTAENNVTVEPPAKATKEGVKKTPVAASPLTGQKDLPKKHPISASSPPPPQKDVVKKTYASIVKDNKEAPPVVKPKIARPVSKLPTKVVDESAKPLQAAETTPASASVTKSSTSHDEQGYSIFVRGLPSRCTVDMVGKEFTKFGAIKPGGIQVRNNKFDELCFGFVEFESQKSMQEAIEASPIFIAEHKIIIEQKQTSTRVVNGVVMNAAVSGRFQYGRGAHNFRGQGGGYVNNANYRGADNFNRRDDGGDHYNRRDGGGNNFNRRDDGGNNYNRAPQGNGYHQNGNGFHQPRHFQNENGRYARVNGPKQTQAAA